MFEFKTGSEDVIVDLCELVMDSFLTLDQNINPVIDNAIKVINQIDIFTCICCYLEADRFGFIRQYTGAK